MYSPKIEESLIPVLYHIAKDRGMPMTKLVTHLIGKALADEKMPTTAHEALSIVVGAKKTKQSG